MARARRKLKFAKHEAPSKDATAAVREDRRPRLAEEPPRIGVSDQNAENLPDNQQSKSNIDRIDHEINRHNPGEPPMREEDLEPRLKNTC